MLNQSTKLPRLTKTKVLSMLALVAIALTATFLRADSDRNEHEDNPLAGTWVGHAGSTLAPALVSFMADGRVISGKDALAAKLINATGEVEDAYAEAMKLGNVKSATVIRYESPFKLGKIFRLLGQSEKTSVEVNVAKVIGPKLEAGHLYFLPSFYAP